MKLLFRRLPLVLCALLAAGPGCAKKGDPVEAALDRIVKAARARDASAVAENLTADFRDAEGEDTAAVTTTLRHSFAAYEIIDVKIRDLEIERAPESARARFVAELSGQPRKIGGLDRFFPSAAAYRFDLRLAPDGSRWKVAWASWEVVGSR